MFGHSDMYILVAIHIYIYIHIHTHVHSYLYCHICICIYLFKCICIFTYLFKIYMFIRAHIHILYIYIYIHNCICICVYITHVTHVTHTVHARIWTTTHTHTDIRGSYIDRYPWYPMDSSAASLAASNGLVCIALAVLDAHMLFMPGVGANDSPMAESEANLRGWKRALRDLQWGGSDQWASRCPKSRALMVTSLHTFTS